MSDAPKFTPGPWNVADMPTASLYVTSKSGYVIANVGASGAYEKAMPHNARLIAAAPELYAALRALLTAQGNGGGTTVDNARAALAKVDAQ